MVTVTIARLMGSGGSYVGRLVARRLGFKYIDREILYEAARRLGTDEKFLAHSLVNRNAGSRPRVEYLPVTITRWPPGERVYGK